MAASRNKADRSFFLVTSPEKRDPNAEILSCTEVNPDSPLEPEGDNDPDEIKGLADAARECGGVLWRDT